MQKYVIFIGIDMSKSWFDAALYWSTLKGQKPGKRFDNTPEGFENFLQWVNKLQTRNQIRGTWFVCMEHTGVYGLALARHLKKRSIKVVMESPLRIERSLGLRRGKTDAADANSIADYAYEKHAKIKVRPLPSQRLLRVQALLSLRARLVRYRQGLNVAANELDGLVDEVIAAPVIKSTDLISRRMEQQITHIEKKVKQLLRGEKQLKSLYDLVISVIGIGPVITAYLLVYTNGFTAFETARQFACYIGIAPFPYSSGTSVKRPDQVSFLANTRLKALISSAATVAVVHDPELKAFFKKHQARGKEDGWIYNAVKNKIVHRIFAVVKRGTPYVVMNRHEA